MKPDLFEVVFRDEQGEILVGYADTIAKADGLIRDREERLMIEDVRRGLVPTPKDDSDANTIFRARLLKQICKYASRRAG